MDPALIDEGLQFARRAIALRDEVAAKEAEAAAAAAAEDCVATKAGGGADSPTVLTVNSQADWLEGTGFRTVREATAAALKAGRISQPIPEEGAVGSTTAGVHESIPGTDTTFAPSAVMDAAPHARAVDARPLRSDCAARAIANEGLCVDATCAARACRSDCRCSGHDCACSGSMASGVSSSRVCCCADTNGQANSASGGSLPTAANASHGIAGSTCSPSVPGPCACCAPHTHACAPADASSAAARETLHASAHDSGASIEHRESRGDSSASDVTPRGYKSEPKHLTACSNPSTPAAVVTAAAIPASTPAALNTEVSSASTSASSTAVCASANGSFVPASPAGSVGSLLSSPALSKQGATLPMHGGATHLVPPAGSEGAHHSATHSDGERDGSHTLSSRAAETVAAVDVSTGTTANAQVADATASGMAGGAGGVAVAASSAPHYTSLRTEIPMDGGSMVMPAHFGIVEYGVYRCAFPPPEAYDFLSRIHVKTIINLLDRYPDEYQRYVEERGITYHHLAVKGNKAHCEEMDRGKVLQALRVIIDARCHPVLVHCRSGKHRTGALIGCMRMLQHWDMDRACEEYVKYCQHKQRGVDKQYIERFDPRTLQGSHPPTEFLASWLPPSFCAVPSKLEQQMGHGGDFSPAPAPVSAHEPVSSLASSITSDSSTAATLETTAANGTMGAISSSSSQSAAAAMPAPTPAPLGRLGSTGTSGAPSRPTILPDASGKSVFFQAPTSGLGSGHSPTVSASASGAATAAASTSASATMPKLEGGVSAS